ncbi:MAG: hypothetical protein HY687_02260 [Chloroflexi bacterium]|nr:hypothetical protein [Chloroflexota bacterium]
MTVRSLYPTDLLALTQFSGRARPNEVVTRESLWHPESRNLPPSELLEEWFTIRGRRYSLVAGDWSHIEGFISARRRSGRGAWEVERLLLADGSPEVPLSLLERLSAMGVRRRVKRLFLRLPAGSPLVEVAGRAGFSPYLTEFLYRRQAVRGESPTPSAFISPFREAKRGDDYGLFRLYCATYPADRRSQEGPTLQDWQEARERPFSQELVWEGEEGLRAWLRLASGHESHYFELMVHPEQEGSIYEMVDWALSLSGGRSEALSLVPMCRTRLRQALREKGFEEQRELLTMVKHLAVRLHLPAWSPKLARLGERT